MNQQQQQDDEGGISLQLFVQILLMVVAFFIATVVFVYTYGQDRWKGPWAVEAYQILGNHDRPVAMPDFVSRKKQSQTMVQRQLMPSGPVADETGAQPVPDTAAALTATGAPPVDASP